MRHKKSTNTATGAANQNDDAFTIPGLHCCCRQEQAYGNLDEYQGVASNRIYSEVASSLKLQLVTCTRPAQNLICLAIFPLCSHNMAVIWPFNLKGENVSWGRAETHSLRHLHQLQVFSWCIDPGLSQVRMKTKAKEGQQTLFQGTEVGIPKCFCVELRVSINTLLPRLLALVFYFVNRDQMVVFAEHERRQLRAYIPKDERYVSSHVGRIPPSGGAVSCGRSMS